MSDASFASALCLAALLAVAGCQKNETTPRGTEVLAWTSASATRRSVAVATEIGPRVVKDVILHVRPDYKGAVKLALHVEAAPIELVERDGTSRQSAPLVVRARLVQNADWTVTARCGEGPQLRLPTLVGGSLVTPEDMVLGCSLGMRYQDTFNDLTYAVAVEVGGDGSVKPSIAGGRATLE